MTVSTSRRRHSACRMLRRAWQTVGTHARVGEATQQFAEFVLVRRDQVAALQQFGIHIGMHRGRIEHAHQAMAPAQLQGRADGVEVALQLHQQAAGIGEHGLLGAQEFEVKGFVGGKVDQDPVRTLCIHDDAGRGCRGFRAGVPTAAQPFVFGVGARARRQGIVTERADEHDLAALAQGRDRLIESLATRTAAEAEGAPGFAGFRKTIRQPDVVLHITANHDEGEIRLMG